MCAGMQLAALSGFARLHSRHLLLVGARSSQPSLDRAGLVGEAA